MWCVLFSVIFLSVHTGLSSLSLYNNNGQRSIFNSILVPRKREANFTTDSVRLPQLDFLNPKEEQSFYQGTQNNEPEPYGYTVNALAITPPSAARVVDPRKADRSHLEFPKYLKVPPPLPYPQFLNMRNNVKSMLARFSHSGHHQPYFPSTPFPAKSPRPVTPFSYSTVPTHRPLFSAPTRINLPFRPYNTPTPQPLPVSPTPPLPPYIPAGLPVPSPSPSFPSPSPVPKYLPSPAYQNPVPVYHPVQHEPLFPPGPYRSPLRPDGPLLYPHHAENDGHISLCFENYLCVRVTPYIS